MDIIQKAFQEKPKHLASKLEVSIQTIYHWRWRYKNGILSDDVKNKIAGKLSRINNQ